MNQIQVDDRILFCGLLATGLMAVVVLGFALPARADNGPHGGYTAATDTCAGCHRAHTAAGQKLLISAVPGLCNSCHGSTGTGADTNVTDGIYVERDGVAETSVEGAPNRGLRAGGFTYATMDTDYDAAAAPATVTSSHLVDGSTGTAWGSGALGMAGPGASIPLSCTSCHDPHGRAASNHTATYRLLRFVPQGSGGAGINVADQSAKTYTVSDADNQYYGENYSVRATQLSNWCSQCHSRYLAGSGSDTTSSGDPVFMYRHQSNSALVGCMTCHVAHGTTAAMGYNSGGVAWPGGATAPNGNNRSSLLRVDNRGVCELCHGL